MVFENLYLFDEKKRIEAGGIICGVDEAGRGPLCGPVCCAAVILRPDTRFDALTDSKKVSEKNRERLYGEIVEQAVCYSIVMVDNNKIDEINNLQATLLGMKHAIEQLTQKPALALIDGNKVPETDTEMQFIVKGDSNSASIAAASILAKVTRDKYMRKLDKEFPEYGFAKHKGYPTKEHYQAIKEHGICEFHRKSFL
ncbi:MAG: ribonuclease HII, partial [Oscillospiraceae bacterium]